MFLSRGSQAFLRPSLLHWLQLLQILLLEHYVPCVDLRVVRSQEVQDLVGVLLRSNVESTYSAKKRRFGRRGRGRSPTSQRLEESVSWVGYNMSLVPRVRYEFGLDIHFGG